MTQILARFDRRGGNGERFGLYIIDLDGFKDVNDNLGHTVGDELLRLFAQRLLHHFKRKTDYVARYGGDEFVVVVSEFVGSEMHVTNGLTKYSKALIKSLTEPYTIDGHELTVTGSVGLTLCMSPEKHITPIDVINRADAAMYEAKANGKNQFVLYNKNKNN